MSSHSQVITNVYKNKPILLFCKHALSPGGKRCSMRCTSRLTCKQQYDKTWEEMEMNFLINAYCFALVGPGFLLMRSGGMDITTWEYDL